MKHGKRAVYTGCAARHAGLTALLATALMPWTPHDVRAQSVCTPSNTSNEARLLAFSAIPLAFASALPKPSLGRGEIAIGVELSAIPEPPASIQRSDECFVEKGQNTQLSRVLPRPRLAVGLPGGVTAEVSYLPPVTVASATPSLLGVALGYTVPVTPSVAAMLRAHGTLGFIDGPVTCAPSALQDDPTQPCFGTEPSNDRYAPNAYGAELLVGARLSSRVTASIGAGASHLRPRFRVGFRNGFGLLDETRVEQNFTRATGMAQVTGSITPRVHVGAQVYAVARDGATVRLTTQWLLR